MDVAVSMSSSERASYDPLQPALTESPPSLQAQRSLQQSMSDLTSAHSPRRFHTPSSRTSPTPPSFHHLENVDMDLAPLVTQHEAHSTWRSTDPHTTTTLLDGQDHDRMETDDEENDSSSDEELGDHNQEGGQPDATENNHTASEYDEVMDTTPDEPHNEESAVAPPPESPPYSPTSPPAVNDVTPEAMATNAHMPDEVDPSSLGAPPTNVDTPPEVPQTTAEQLPAPAQESTEPPSTEVASLEDLAPPPPAAAGETTVAQQGNNEQDNHERPEEREDEESQDGESSDEEERAYWAEFVEDTSSPSERELKAIEEDGQETDGLDHEHWESITFENLEDPEYIPGDYDRITWTVNPVHGTPAAPNRERVMQSPSKLIGGHYWSIKYYPRGNDGTEHMSVYIECSPSPPGDEGSGKCAEGEAKGASTEGDGPQSSNAARNTAAELDDLPQSNVPASEESQPGQEISETDPDVDQAGETETWEIAAQVGCVVYNPNEPRVNTFRKSSHAFNSQNSDWGWTRFHGPWETIHQRQRHQRSALLRNDTLAFTAYIRTVKDDTRSLWWHAPKKGADWDSYERIGVKSLATGNTKDNAIIAALSCWLHLSPIVELIKAIAIPDSISERKRPLFGALQQLLQYMFSKPEDTDRSSMEHFVAWLDWYVAVTNKSRYDMPNPVSVWEHLRRVLNYEASGTGDMTTTVDCLQSVLLLKQPDPWRDESPIFAAALGHDSATTTQSQPREPRSVQETVDLACLSDNEGQPWPGFVNQEPKCRDSPLILQVELHRQHYDRKARHWDKLTHRIELDEQITYTAPGPGARHDYTLFGMIVHSGGLDSQDFYTVIRPQGPGTRWIKYTGGSLHKEASCLTTTQAVTAHEGKGNSSTGNAAVAYVVLYVQTNMLSSILLPPEQANQAKPLASQPIMKPENADAEEDISIRTFRSTIFNSHMGRGLPDLWETVTKGIESPYCDLHLPKSTTLTQVTEHLDSLHPKELDKNECSLYYLEIGLHTPRGLPRLVAARPSDTIEEVASKYDGCRIWVHYQPEAKKQNTHDAAADQEPTETQQAQSAVQNASGEPAVADNTSDEPTDAEMTQEPPMETPVQVEEADAHDEDQDGPGSPASRSQSPSRDGVPTGPPQEATQGDTEAEDAVMADTQELNNIADSEQSGATHVSPTVPQIYFFLKLFDSQAQTLRGVGSKRVPIDSDIHTQVTVLLGSDDTFDIFHERSRRMQELDRVRPPRTFEAQHPCDGGVYIAQRRPTPEETEKLLAEGKHPNPISYFTYLRYNDDPIYLNSHYVDCAFGTAEYQSVCLLNGQFHGPGTIISPNGDAYTGNYVSSYRSGNGTMAYANGDTYVGNFSRDERDGQGTMTYHTTNNTYEGGWKKGRRHGKGTMKFEVADEEMQMCKICYENEMDAVFYDCGHVVACEECARQVDHCPVCRKGIRGVCRIWRT
ncbi:MAG: hypothetical protein Q9218_004127 [Villophora microphyllina]